MFSILFLVIAFPFISYGAVGSPGNRLEAYPAIRPYFLDSTDLDTLKLVQVLHRHGDRNRNVDTSYPNDPHWDVQIGSKGKGQLTAIGKANGFELGKYLRARYDGFLSSTYSIDEIYAYASDRDRTIMTCQALLAGLFPPTPGDPESNWSSKLKWQPIPVHVISESIDNKLVQRKAYCPKYASLAKAMLLSDPYKSFDENHRAFYEFLAQNTGRRIKNAVEAFELIDILIVERAHGLRLPTWTDEPGFWITAIDIGLKYFERNEGSGLMQRLRIGPLFTEFLGNMEKKRNESGAVPKLIEWSGHDSTVFSLLAGFGVDSRNIKLPPYASAVLVELHKKATTAETDPYFVKLFYRNETQSPAYELEVPGCGSPCSLDKLKELKAELIVSQEAWSQECVHVHDKHEH